MASVNSIIAIDMIGLEGEPVPGSYLAYMKAVLRRVQTMQKGLQNEVDDVMSRGSVVMTELRNSQAQAITSAKKARRLMLASAAELPRKPAFCHDHLASRIGYFSSQRPNGRNAP